MARPRVAHALRPSAGSSQRVTGNLRSAKWSGRREERYRVVSRSRSALLDSPEARGTEASAQDPEKGRKCTGEIQVVDLLHEDVEGQGVSPSKVGRSARGVGSRDGVFRSQPFGPTGFPFPSSQTSLDAEAIMCNNTKMLRERLNISGDGLGEQNWDQDSEYVYDLYYQEMVTPGWIQDILSVRAYADEGELVRGGAGYCVPA